MVEQVVIQEPETTSDKPEAQQTEVSRPDGLPEKFNSVEDLAKSYTELEKKLGQADKPAEPEVKQEEQPKTEDNNLEIAEKAVSDAGLNMDNLQQEYNENGQLNDKSYEALEKAGIPKSYVDAFINGQQALANQQSAEIKSVVGGDEVYNQMADWAKENLSESEKKAYNDTVNSKNIDSIKLAVAGLKAKFDQANGTEPNLLQGKASPTNEGSYESWAQVTEAMADPRYSKDVAYQNAVKAKLANSDL